MPEKEALERAEEDKREGKGRRRARKPESLYERKSNTFARASTALARLSKL